jgi:hypothetical protein
MSGVALRIHDVADGEFSSNHDPLWRGSMEAIREMRAERLR